MQTRFTEFLELFIHYACSRCVVAVTGHPQQQNTDGRHAHNGEILPYLQGVEPTADRILSAWHAWQDLRTRANCQKQLARAYTRGRPRPDGSPTAQAVRRIFKYENSTWIRHGIELPDHCAYSPEQPYPPDSSRHTVGAGGRQPNTYAVDMDSWPFRAFEEHFIENRLGPPWVYTVGVLPLELCTGTVIQLPDRDHYYVIGAQATEDWLFLYRELDGHAQSPNSQNRARDRLLRSDLPRLHEEEYTRLYTLIRHLRNLARLEQRCQR